VVLINWLGLFGITKGWLPSKTLSTSKRNYIGSNYMTSVMSFEDRGRSFESKYAMDQELAFKIEAKTTHLVAQWAAERIGLDEHQSAKFVDELDKLVLVEKGQSLVKEKLLSNFSSNKIDISENALERLFLLKHQLASKQLLSGSAS
jgi:hypothetical protein